VVDMSVKIGRSMGLVVIIDVMVLMLASQAKDFLLYILLAQQQDVQMNFKLRPIEFMPRMDVDIVMTKYQTSFV